ncbi:MAG TPA: YkgJ family cysteine cluster protein [Dissulfurispiraceae bacterium]|nr:YkgJ family cysteine cluster protein [Dissulfurispiraceae bacterium]
MKDQKISTRLHFPEDEKLRPWLPLLLDAYAIIDKGVSTVIREHEKKSRTKLACKKGCGQCCRTHSDIPLYPLEMVGIYWYTIEKLGQPLRGIVKRQLLEHRKGRSCPFQVDNACAIHAFRPIACRQFNVFSAPCAEGEDPYYTRRKDVLTPSEKFTNQAIMVMLPFYGVTDEAAKACSVKTGFIHTQVHVIQACDWKELALRFSE